MQLDFFPRRPRRLRGLFFQLPVKRQDFPPEFRQLRAAAAFAPVCGKNERFLETAVHGLDERPGAHVGHFHTRRGFADGTGFGDVLQQFRLARPQRDFLSAGDAEAGRQ